MEPGSDPPALLDFRCFLLDFVYLRWTLGALGIDFFYLGRTMAALGIHFVYLNGLRVPRGYILDTWVRLWVVRVRDFILDTWDGLWGYCG